MHVEDVRYFVKIRLSVWLRYSTHFKKKNLMKLCSDVINRRATGTDFLIQYSKEKEQEKMDVYQKPWTWSLLDHLN